MSISVIALALAAQAAGREVTTFHPLPSQPKEEQAQEQPQPQGSDQAAGSALKAAEAQAPTEPEVIEVLSVRKIPPSANVRFVPPEGEEPE